MSLAMGAAHCPLPPPLVCKNIGKHPVIRVSEFPGLPAKARSGGGGEERRRRPGAAVVARSGGEERRLRAAVATSVDEELRRRSQGLMRMHAQSRADCAHVQSGANGH